MHAQVFKCYRRDDPEKKTLAVKITREQDEEKRLAHSKEFNITKMLDHQNVVKGIDYF